MDKITETIELSVFLLIEVSLVWFDLISFIIILQVSHDCFKSITQTQS